MHANYDIGVENYHGNRFRVKTFDILLESYYLLVTSPLYLTDFFVVKCSVGQTCWNSLPHSQIYVSSFQGKLSASSQGIFTLLFLYLVVLYA